MGKEDERIIDAIKQDRDNEALSILYSRTLKKVIHFVKKNSGTQNEAEDVFQDAVVVFFDAVKENKLKPDTSVDGYIFTVARNVWFRKLNRDKKIITTDFDYESMNQPEVSFFDGLIEEEKATAFASVFNTLQERCKTLLTYIYFHKHTMNEICEKMGYKNADVAKANHYRCKKSLLDLASKNSEVVLLLKNI